MRGPAVHAERAALRRQALALAADGHGDVAIACQLMVRWALVRDWLDDAAPPLRDAAGFDQMVAEHGDAGGESRRVMCVLCAQAFYTRRAGRVRCASCS